MSCEFESWRSTLALEQLYEVLVTPLLWYVTIKYNITGKYGAYKLGLQQKLLKLMIKLSLTFSVNRFFINYQNIVKMPITISNSSR